MNIQYIRLKQDTKNPLGDKRSSDWRHRPVFPAGTQFAVVPRTLKDGTVEPTVLRPSRFGGYGLWFGDQQQAVNAILAASEPDTPDLGRLLAAATDQGCSTGAILASLLDAGVVSLDQLAAAAKACIAKSEAETDEFDKRHNII
jgi:hypothetical protein